MSSVNDLINQINKLSGFSIPSSSVVYTSGALTPHTSSQFPNATVYVPAAPPYGTIPTEGIYPGGVIKSEQILRIIDALNGVNVDTIIISGSFNTSGSNTLNGNLALPFLHNGDYLYISGGFVTGSQSFSSSSYAVSASYAISSSHANNSDRAITASYALFSEYGTGVIGATATYIQATPASVWNFNHKLGVEYPVVTVYDAATNSEIIPLAVTPLDANNLQVRFVGPRAGRVVAVVGGGYFSTTSGSVRQLTQDTPATTWYFNHGLGDLYPVITVYSSGSNNIIYPANIHAVDLFNTVITFDTPTAGTAIATVGGYVNNTASFAYTASFALNSLSASYFSGSISNALFAISSSYASSSTQLIAGNNKAVMSTNPSSIFLIKSAGDTILNVDSVGNIITNGSISIETSGSFSNFMLIRNNGKDLVKVNNEGVLVLHQYDTPPTAVSGGMYFDMVGNFYVGL